MTSDRELLKLAAKAAWIELSDWSSAEDGFIRYHFVTRHIWNPLTDDGDALRLAVKLKLLVDVSPVSTSVHAGGVKDVAFEWHENALAPLDPYAATRRAIVRAAAEIGKENNHE